MKGGDCVPPQPLLKEQRNASVEGGGSQELRTPLCYQRPGRPDRGVRTSRFEGSQNLLGPNVLESLLGYKRVQGALKGPRSVR
jgi:hypothetical protein